MTTKRKAKKTESTTIPLLDEGEIEYLTKIVLAETFARERAAAFLLLIEAISNDPAGLAGPRAMKTVFYESDTGEEIAEGYVTRLRGSFSRHGILTQPPDLDGAIEDVHKTLGIAYNPH